MKNAKTFNQKINKSQRFIVMKSDDDKRQVFGWGSVAARADGEVIEDFQEDIIEIEDLEKAVYDYTANFGTAGEMHERGGVGELIESVVFTKEKTTAMGIPDGILPAAWWLGFHITDGDVWEKIKTGEYNMFSIEGTGVREEMQTE